MQRKILSLVIGLTFAISVQAKTPTQSLDRVVAIVNDSVVTESELGLSVKAAKQQMAMEHHPEPDQNALRKQALDRIIFDTLVLQIAKRNNVEIPSAEVDNAISNMAKQNHMDLDQLKFTLQRDGISYDLFRKRINNQMMIAKVQQQAISPKISVTESEVASYMKSETNKQLGSGEYHLIHILLPLAEAPTPEQIKTTQARANVLYQKIKSGESFEKIASNSSSGADALAGGDLGWRKAGEIPSIFTKSLSTMKVGDISRPVHAPNGFHIVKLVEVRNDSTKLSPQEVKNQLFRRKFDEQLQVWLQQLRDSAFVKTML